MDIPASVSASSVARLDWTVDVNYPTSTPLYLTGHLRVLPLRSSRLCTAMPGQWHRGARSSGTVDPSGSQDNEAGPSASATTTSTLERPPGCINKYPTPPFSLLCTVMDRLRSEEASKRRNTLETLFKLWREKVGNDLYPLIRLLLPDVRDCLGQR